MLLADIGGSSAIKRLRRAEAHTRVETIISKERGKAYRARSYIISSELSKGELSCLVLLSVVYIMAKVLLKKGVSNFGLTV